MESKIDQTQTQQQSNQNTQKSETSGTAEEAFKAATHDVDEAAPKAPGPAQVKRETTNR